MSRKKPVLVKACPTCGEPMYKSRDTSRREFLERDWCSTPCRNKVRFWQRVDKTGDDLDCCWLWTGRRDDTGYGLFHFESKVWKAHRASIIFAGQEIPDGMFVCHHCDNPPCVRPAHLYVGTGKDNMRDASWRGRLSKLKAPDIREIRRLYEPEDEHSVTALAQRFSVESSTIWSILSRKTWDHVL